jgi:hypothetical protein
VGTRALRSKPSRLGTSRITNRQDASDVWIVKGHYTVPSEEDGRLRNFVIAPEVDPSAIGPLPEQ